MKPSEVYVEAAMRVEDGRQKYACIAIGDVIVPGYGWKLPSEGLAAEPYIKRYLDWFAKDAPRSPGWDNDRHDTHLQLAMDGQDHRVLMLCMAATLAEEAECKRRGSRS